MGRGKALSTVSSYCFINSNLLGRKLKKKKKRDRGTLLCPTHKANAKDSTCEFEVNYTIE